MDNNTLSLAKSFEKDCERYEELTRPYNQDGTYSPFACILDSNRALEICRIQASLEQTANLVSKNKMKDFMNSKFIQRSMNILQMITKR